MLFLGIKGFTTRNLRVIKLNNRTIMRHKANLSQNDLTVLWNSITHFRVTANIF